MITLHHLHQSRSFRIVWLMEELGLPYDLVCHDRKPDLTASDTLGAVHALKKAPVIVDGTTVMFESGAIVEYIIHRYGQGRLSVPSHHMHYASYLQWLHAAEGICFPALIPIILPLVTDAPAPTKTQSEFSDTVLRLSDDALADRDYFGGTEFTAADIMMEMYLALAARFTEPAFAPRSRLLPFLTRVQARDAYRRAKEITEPQSAATG